MKPIYATLGDTALRKGTEINTRVGVVFFEPGNGSRYDLVYGQTPNIHDIGGPHLFFCTWMLRGGSGGVTVKHPIGKYCHWNYVKEKMNISAADAKAISQFINKLNGVEDSDPDDRITNAMNEVIDGVGLPHLEKKLRDLKKEIKSEGDTK